tara:strand:- start:635 stop:1588 length:954 start_codon:yes stop_codon:yes gene_type:complete
MTTETKKQAQQMADITTHITSQEGVNVEASKLLIQAALDGGRAGAAKEAFKADNESANSLVTRAVQTILVDAAIEGVIPSVYTEDILQSFRATMASVESAVKSNYKGFAVMLGAKVGDNNDYVMPQSLMSAKSTNGKCLKFGGAFFAEDSDGNPDADNAYTYQDVRKNAAMAKRDYNEEAYSALKLVRSIAEECSSLSGAVATVTCTKLDNGFAELAVSSEQLQAVLDAVKTMRKDMQAVSNDAVAKAKEAKSAKVKANNAEAKAEAESEAEAEATPEAIAADMDAELAALDDAATTGDTPKATRGKASKKRGKKAA